MPAYCLQGLGREVTWSKDRMGGGYFRWGGSKKTPLRRLLCRVHSAASAWLGHGTHFSIVVAGSIGSPRDPRTGGAWVAWVPSKWVMIPHSS